jgi:hypothetical protein
LLRSNCARWTDAAEHNHLNVFSLQHQAQKRKQHCVDVAYLAHIDRHRPTFQLFLLIPFNLAGILINS